MKLTQYQVAAFANKPFEGNPAAVCPLDEWLSDDLMQAIAAENNLAETAFFVSEGDDFKIRWFTPAVEVALCGHATLASAYVLFEEMGYAGDSVVFHSMSGPLSVAKKADLFELNFPAQLPEKCATPEGLEQALGTSIQQCYFNQDYVVEMDSEQALLDLQPDFNLLAQIEARGIIVTAKSASYDFVNRFFGPQVGIDEDPVTGSAFTKLIPLWADKLGKTKMQAKQVSQRGGEVNCELLDTRVSMSGRGVLFLRGEIIV